MIGQVLFLVVFTVLVAGAARWGARDVRHAGRLSELASLSLSLLAFLGAVVFVLALSSGAGSSGLPLAARLPAGLLIATTGLVLVVRRDRARYPFARALGSPRAGVVLLAIGAVTMLDSGVALLLILLGAAASRTIWPSRDPRAG